jgi:hypothetical protein
LVTNIEAGIASGGTYTLKIVLSGTSIIISVNDTEYINTTDSTWSTGTKVGWYAFNTGGSWDDFTVTT